jgi:hypothetical protein
MGVILDAGKKENGFVDLVSSVILEAQCHGFRTYFISFSLRNLQSEHDFQKLNETFVLRTTSQF